MRNFCLLTLLVALFSCCKRDVTTEFVNDISCYYDYSTVDWDGLSQRFYCSNAADWEPMMNGRVVDGFPMEISARFWHFLQSARFDFHIKSLPLRTKAAQNLLNALDEAEAAFDTVFVRCVSQEYYMRLFPEVYNETVKPAIDELVQEMKKCNNRKS